MEAGGEHRGARRMSQRAAGCRRGCAGRRSRSARCAARPGNACASRARPRYSGRNSWPQAETQCASSIAISAICRRASRSSVPGDQQPLRRHVEQVEPPGLERRAPLRPASSGSSSECSARRRDAELAQRRDLVVHQRDQRRDDDAPCPAGTAPAPGSRGSCRRRSASAPARRRPPRRGRSPLSCRPRNAGKPKTRRSTSAGAARRGIMRPMHDLDPAALDARDRRRSRACGRRWMRDLRAPRARPARPRPPAPAGATGSGWPAACRRGRHSPRRVTSCSASACAAARPRASSDRAAAAASSSADCAGEDDDVVEIGRAASGSGP